MGARHRTYAEETMVGGATLLIHVHPVVFLCTLGGVVVLSLVVLVYMMKYLRRVVRTIMDHGSTALST